MPAGSLVLVNQSTEQAVADRVEVAVTRRARSKGLLGRTSFEVSSALILAPCLAIHTMFLRFAIDVVFVDEDGRALRMVPELGPWRVAVEVFAHAVVQLPAGSLRERHVNVGDRLYLLKESGDRVLLSASDMRERAC